MLSCGGHHHHLLLLPLLLLAGAVSADGDGNHTGNGTEPGGGFVPVVFTKVNQIIAREGSCVLIDCNVSGEPLPSFQWFNSHGDRLDTENGEASDTPLKFHVGSEGITGSSSLGLSTASLCGQLATRLCFTPVL